MVDPGDIWQTMANLANPDANFLDMLGRTREERVEKMASMLRNSDDGDIAEMGVVFGLAMAKVDDESVVEAPDRGRDPVVRWADGVRRLSRFDPRDVWRGLENLSRRSAGGMLDSLGRTRRQRVDRMAALLRGMTPADMEEMGTTYALAAALAIEYRDAPPGRATPRPRPEGARRPREMTSAEWRRARRSGTAA